MNDPVGCRLNSILVSVYQSLFPVVRGSTSVRKEKEKTKANANSVFAISF